MKSKRIISAVVICLAAAVGVACYGTERKKEKEEKIEISRVATKADSDAYVAAGVDNIPDTEAPDSFVTAYICGEVSAPGVYRLRDGSRINDLLEAAGGFTEKASTVSINLAGRLNDGEMIYIPSEEELSSQRASPFPAGSSDGRININIADIKTLMSLPGIGEEKAKAIIEFRTEKGFFGEPSEIKKVKGIGEGLYSRIESLITV